MPSLIADARKAWQPLPELAGAVVRRAAYHNITRPEIVIVFDDGRLLIIKERGRVGGLDVKLDNPLE